MHTLEQQGVTYLDTAATAQKPEALLRCIQNHYTQGVGNVHRAQHELGRRTTEAFEQARHHVATWLNAPSDAQLIFTKGTTESVNLVAYALESSIQPGDEILISALEHHANLLPWQQLALRRQAKLVVIPLDANRQPDCLAAQELMTPKTRLLAVSQLSNVLGNWIPLKTLLALAKQKGIPSFVDGAQAVVHQQPDLQAIGCDFYAFSAHKLYGPDGLGVLMVSPAQCPRLKHWQFGGEMLEHTTYQEATFRAPPLGFEAGTPPITSVLGLSAVLSYLEQLDQRAIAQHEQQLHQHLTSGLKARNLEVLGQPQIALACFRAKGIHPADLGSLLTEQGIAVRTGGHCAQPLMQTLGWQSGGIRVSLGLYNNGQDLAHFFSALDHALEILSE